MKHAREPQASGVSMATDQRAGGTHQRRPAHPLPTPARPRMARRAGPTLAALAAAAALGGLAGSAQATGMQGHIYMAQCAAEQVRDPRLRGLLETHPKQLANGGYFPDSGYTAKDHDQGEIAHWEPFVEAYIKVIRERYKPPYDGEAAEHIAFLMGLAAHGITDSTFDSLFYERAEQVDGGDFDAFDLSMDVFIAHDKPRYFVPEYAYDAATLSAVYARVPHPVPAENITQAMTTARTGLSAVAGLLYAGADDYGKRYPWARAHVFLTRTPGGYPHGADVVTGYYREILRRLDGDVSADAMLIGSYPDANRPMVTLDAARADGKVVLFFGHGLDRKSITADSVVITDPAGNVVPTKTAPYRGDTYPNVLTVKSSARWAPATKYRVRIAKDLRTLNGVSPAKDLELTFETCTPSVAGGDCDAPSGPAPASACPVLDASYKTRPGQEPEPTPEATPDAGPPAAPQASATPEKAGCAATPWTGNTTGLLLLSLALPVIALRRRR